MKTESFVNSGVEVSDLMDSKSTTLESDRIKGQGSWMTLKLVIEVAVKFHCDSRIKMKSESVFSPTPDLCQKLPSGLLIITPPARNQVDWLKTIDKMKDSKLKLPTYLLCNKKFSVCTYTGKL